ncbi:glycosyltransferase family 2 protein [Frankia sp. B2]|uniref:Glycosyl transferase, family 2 n=2 Tax=Frankia TaxID=1854 RepID=Q2JCN7_FRACC|nr:MULTISPECIES: glycosyltransferase family 2 protein [unclassified Frankia]ABD10955.1 glycosyl transferase, family 2 [Frankia casuarinae]OHV57930.1 glycosyl transferase [Frankia sp. CgIS1]ORT52355.1 glycosyl transferase [Frankia sp. KB5]TFE30468.1 glycosyltransferase family 2 protein [Frankia sp. B2]
MSGSGDSPSVSVVIPALNEARNLREVFGRLPVDAEIILVDGNSTDDTVRLARELRPDVVVVRQTRYGKGNAMACGFAVASGDIVVTLDADGSADPAEIPSFVAALVQGADFVKGTRFAHRGGSNDITLLRTLGNLFFCHLVNLLFHRRFTDLCYGYNAFRRDCLPMLGLMPGETDGIRRHGDGFEIETLITLRATKACLRVTEVGSFEHKRLHGASNLNAGRDGMRVLRTILVEWSENLTARSRNRARWDGMLLSSPGQPVSTIVSQRRPGDLPHGRRRTTGATEYA